MSDQEKKFNGDRIIFPDMDNPAVIDLSKGRLELVSASNIEGCTTESIPVAARMDSMGTLISHMVNILINRKGLGLAAPQVGVSASVFVARFREQPGKIGVIFDPSYTYSGKSSKKKRSTEWSLSYPNQAYTVKRYMRINVRYTNVEGGVIERRLKGEDAILFQQMTDYLNGITIKTLAKEQEI